MDGDDRPYGPLDPRHVAHAWSRLRGLGDEPARLPPDEPPLPHRDRGGVLRARLATSRACAPARDPRPEHHAGRRGRSPVLRRAPTSRRVRRLGDRAPRRRIRALLRADAPGLPENGRRSGRPAPPMVRGLARAVRLRAPLEVHHRRAARRPAGAGRLSVAAAGRRQRLGHAKPVAREGPLRRSGDAGVAARRPGHARLCTAPARSLRHRAKTAGLSLRPRLLRPEDGCCRSACRRCTPTRPTSAGARWRPCSPAQSWWP